MEMGNATLVAPASAPASAPAAAPAATVTVDLFAVDDEELDPLACVICMNSHADNIKSTLCARTRSLKS